MSHFDHDQLAMDYSDLTPLDHNKWKMMLPFDKQELVWRSLGVKFFLDETTGNNCFLLGASNLKINVFSGMDTFSTEPHPKSRFREVAKMIYSVMIAVECTIKREMLSPNTSYSAYLVFGFVENCLKPHRAYSNIRTLREDGGNTWNKQGDLVYFHDGKSRADEWMEMHLGDFYVGVQEYGDIQIKLVDINVHWRSAPSLLKVSSFDVLSRCNFRNITNQILFLKKH